MTGKCIKVPKTLRWLGIGNENYIHTPSHLELDQLASNKATRPGTRAHALLASRHGEQRQADVWEFEADSLYL